MPRPRLRRSDTRNPPANRSQTLTTISANTPTPAIRGPILTGPLYTAAMTAKETRSSTTTTVTKNARSGCSGRARATDNSARANAVSVDNATPHPRAAGPPPFKAW